MKKILTLFVLFSIISENIKAQIDVASFDIVTVCPNSYGQSIAVDNIIFTPNTPGDSVYIGNLSVNNSEIQSYSYINDVGKSIIKIEPVNGFTGTSLIEASIIDDFQGSLLYTFEVKIGEIPSFNLLENAACESETQLKLGDLLTPKGGTFVVYPSEENIGPEDFLNVYQLKENYGANLTSINFDYFYTDTNGCVHVTNETLYLTESPTITIDNVNHSSCEQTDGSIDVSVSSTLSYQGYWNNGNVSENISNLYPGEYTFNALNTEGCSAHKTIVVENTGLAISGTINNVRCKGGASGSIDLDISGGSGNYRTIWLSGKNTPNISDLSAGEYTVTVTDLDDGCQSVKSFTVAEPSNPFDFYFYNAVTPSDCHSNDGKFEGFNATNGAAPYTFEWSTGETSSEIFNLSAGSYRLKVTDILGCEATQEYFLRPTDAPEAFFNVKNADCGLNNGEIEITSMYPAANSTITGVEWGNGNTGMMLNGLSKGEYELTVNQDNGCATEYEITVGNTQFDYNPEICIVTVDTATNTNLVVWEKDFNNPDNIDFYNIYRKNPSTNQYDFVDSVDFDNISVFNDVIASPETRSWSYLISAVNECGGESRLSRKHKTIHLVMNDGQSQDEKILSWDNYEGLDYFTYALHRGTDVDGWQTVDGNIAVTDFPTYTDILPAGATEVDYIIEVIPTAGGCTATFGKAQDYNSSRSNRPSPIFNPGDGTGDPNNGFGDGTTDVVEFENTDFSAIVYPNPSNGNFTLAIDGNDTDEELKLSIVSINGKIIYQDKINNYLNDFHLNAQPGVYFVKLQTQKMTETIRIIIQ
ncbi:hypothetical protein CW751_00820 [Brumimicrobium salinarum]|uniref:Secretion system C-terminal sorting domain-containing protein n=1 Tax=Brumimicrobium salinarum TaxID=2058658 RepID=A0A2I0R5Q2_9FLAO|nr:T9SS type A sorting domain-containing protein [Brumimicrobium salinarum]PKR81911.1 hypothetical protein CW751_00820 [Brumimicrobium salinarum]